MTLKLICLLSIKVLNAPVFETRSICSVSSRPTHKHSLYLLNYLLFQRHSAKDMEKIYPGWSELNMR